MAHVEPEGHEGMPPHLRSVLEAAGWWVPDDGYADEEVEEMFKRNHRGQCLLCEHPLEEDTLLIIDGNGAQHAFCGPACMQDLHVMQQLMVWYDDIVQGARFRHGGGDSGQEQVLDSEEEEELEDILREGAEEAAEAEESNGSGDNAHHEDEDEQQDSSGSSGS